jgi:adenylate cyclase
MARNIEIKARIDSVDELLPRAQAVADGGPPQRIEQDDTFFRVAHGRLKLRVFEDGGGELIHYWRDDVSGPKASDYVISPVPQPDLMREALTRACGLLGRVRKTRLLLMAGATRIHLDHVEGLGDYLELEVVLQQAQGDDEGMAIARSLMERLGVPPDALIEGAYLDMLLAKEKR